MSGDFERSKGLSSNEQSTDGSERIAPSRKKMVGATGFEPATSWTQTTRSSQAELRSDNGDIISKFACAATPNVTARRFPRGLSCSTPLRGMIIYPNMSNQAPSGPNGDKPGKINLRRPDIMEAVQAQVLSHRSEERRVGKECRSR